MDKVYAVMGAIDSSIRGMFSTREDAELMAQSNRNHFDRVEEYHVDAIVPVLRGTHQGFILTVERDGTVSSLKRVYDPNEMGTYVTGGGTLVRFLTASDIASAARQAAGIANDHVANLARMEDSEDEEIDECG